MFAFCIFCFPQMQVKAAQESGILTGVYVEDMSLGGKTTQEARSMVEDYVDSICGMMINYRGSSRDWVKRQCGAAL